MTDEAKKCLLDIKNVIENVIARPICDWERNLYITAGLFFTASDTGNRLNAQRNT